MGTFAACNELTYESSTFTLPETTNKIYWTASSMGLSDTSKLMEYRTIGIMFLLQLFATKSSNAYKKNYETCSIIEIARGNLPCFECTTVEIYECWTHVANHGSWIKKRSLFSCLSFTCSSVWVWVVPCQCERWAVSTERIYFCFAIGTVHKCLVDYGDLVRWLLGSIVCNWN